MPGIAIILPIILYSIIFIVGLINAINPWWAWRTFESWKAKKEPTQTYFVVRRIGGIVAMLIIAALVLIRFIV